MSNEQSAERPPLRVLLCDDHSLIRHALRTILSTDSSCEVIGESATVEEAAKVLQRQTVDIVLLDMYLPDKSGVELLSDERVNLSTTHILFVSMCEDERRVKLALSSGARGYLVKDCSSREVLDAVHAVAEGRYYVSPRLTRLQIHHPILPGTLTTPSEDPLSRLSKREREIFYSLARGIANRYIAKELCISTRTVETHRARVLQKLGCKSTVELIRYAVRNRLIEA